MRWAVSCTVKARGGGGGDRHHFNLVKHLIHTKIRPTFDYYLQTILGLAVQSEDESPSGFIPKMNHLIKNARQNSQGISTILDKGLNSLVTEN